MKELMAVRGKDGSILVACQPVDPEIGVQTRCSDYKEIIKGGKLVAQIL